LFFNLYFITLKKIRPHEQTTDTSAIGKETESYPDGKWLFPRGYSQDAADLKIIGGAD
jgi:hypothetical protein